MYITNSSDDGSLRASPVLLLLAFAEQLLAPTPNTRCCLLEKGKQREGI